MSLAEKNRISSEDYIQGEETAEFKHEYLDGEIWAMVGATDSHVTISGNLFFLLKQKLKNTPCRTYIADMKVNVEKANAYFYPDVFVTCEKKDQENKLFKQDPIFIAEVLSPSTEAFDRGDKFNHYRQLDSLQTYWLIDTQKMQVDSFSRTKNNDWLLQTYANSEQKLDIEHLQCSFLLSDLYEDVLPDLDFQD